MSFKKVFIDQAKPFDLTVLEVDASDSPTYPLLEFVGFGVKMIMDIVTTVANYPRKNEICQGKLDGLIASTSDYLWLAKSWPISMFIDSEEKEWQFDHRHLKRALSENGWNSAPVAYYRRKVTGNELLDNLSDDSVMTLSGLYVNATDGGNPENASMNDFKIISRIMEDEQIPRTEKNVNTFLEVSGIYSRFPKKGHKATIGNIRNSIIENKKKSSRVFNTSKVEVQDWIKSNPLFGYNNYSSVDAVATRHKVLDKSFTYRYANDILKWAFEAWVKGERVRICASSYAICESEIEVERQEIVDAIKDILNNTINWYCAKVENMLAMLNVKLPRVDANDLPIDLYWIPQIEGEIEAIRVPF
jgi:hypothetical protein